MWEEADRTELPHSSHRKGDGGMRRLEYDFENWGPAVPKHETVSLNWMILSPRSSHNCFNLMSALRI